MHPEAGRLIAVFGNYRKLIGQFGGHQEPQPLREAYLVEKQIRN
jgi:hypothetical protein